MMPMSNAPTLQLPAVEALRRCVILLPEGSQRPDRLIDALQQRDLDVDLVADAPQAMGALAADGPHALIVYNPSRQQNLARLLAAVRRYHPTAICWQYDEDGAGLQPYGSPPPSSPEVSQPVETPQAVAVPSVEEATPAPAQPQEQAEGDLPLPSEKPRKAPITAELSQDELAMLLGSPADDDDES